MILKDQSKLKNYRIFRLLGLTKEWDAILLFFSFVLVLIFYKYALSHTFRDFFYYDPKPSFSVQGGFYDNEQKISLSQLKTGYFWYYTLDGSEPAYFSTKYTTPIKIDKTSVLRVKAFRLSKPVGQVYTQTYFIKENTPLPVFSVVTEPKNLWDPKTGIYVEGVNYVPGFPNTPNFAQRGREWERPAYVEFYEPNKKDGFKMNVGIRIFGNMSRFMPQKSLRVCARGTYGDDFVRYPLFPNKALAKYKCFILRNSGNDWRRTMMRDGMVQSLVSDLKLDTQAYRPSVVFINGEYWGIHNIREFYDDDYIKNKYGIDRDSVVIAFPDRTIEGKATLINGNPGDEKSYDEMTEYIYNNDLSDNSKYTHAKSLIDVNNFIDYQATEIYAGNADWMDTNIKVWRFKAEHYDSNAPYGLDGRWRWLLFDTDDSFGLFGVEPYTFNSLKFALSPVKTQLWPPKLFKSLLANEEFKIRFINRYADLLNSNFKSEIVLKKIDDIQNQISPEIPKHAKKWGGQLDKGGNPAFISIEEWQTNVDVLKLYAKERPFYAREHVMKQFNLTGTVNVLLEVSDKNAGYIKINSLDIKSDQFGWEGVYFKEVPINITAVANPGYRFVRWEGSIVSSNITLSNLSLKEDLDLIAVFEKDDRNIIKKILNYD